MRIGIVGAGAIGLLCGAAFSKVGYDVTVVTRGEDQALEMNNDGIKLIFKDGTECIFINTIPFEKCDMQFDLIIIAVKEYQLQPIINKLRVMDKRTVLFLQNGMAHLRVKEELVHHHVHFGIVEHGVKKVSNVSVQWNGVGRIVIGTDKEHDVFLNLQKKCADFFPVQRVDDILFIMTKKLLANICINPLTALLNIKNGELIKNEYFHSMMKQLYDEAASILHITDKQKEWEYVCGICKRTSENTSSMRGDILRGSKTEIESIVGYVLAQCKDVTKEAPLLHFVYEGVKGLETRGRFE